MLVDPKPTPVELVIKSASMQRALEALLLAARRDAPIMLRAEIGSGVGTLARTAHANSPHRDRPFLRLACASMTELPSKTSLVTNGGTVFLEEIGQLPAELQMKLAHLLDELSAQAADIRLISSVRQDVDQDLKHGRLRSDLFFRLNTVEIPVPPLRDRREDIMPLARRFIASLSAGLGRKAPTLSKGAATALLAHSWPGNVRELRNVLERALLIWPADIIEAEAFAADYLGTSSPDVRSR